MDSKQQQLHVVFLPFVAQGHMIPFIDMARLFARHGVKSTIVTTPINASLFSDKIQRDADQGLDIRTHIIEFPFAEAGLPEGCENFSAIKSPDMIIPFFMAMDVFKQPVEELLRLWKPDCIVAGLAFHWATESAKSLGIPRLYFTGSGSFPSSVESDLEPFVVPGLPHRIELKKSQLAPNLKELEPGYSQHYREVMGRKAWFIGPLSLCNDTTLDKAERGDAAAAAIDGHECLSWLECREPNSVLYICFGSMSGVPDKQLLEIAAALEASMQSFIWVVKKRMEGKGLIIRGWAPQVLILDHKATGGFMTHCGWNSMLESVAAGVPMVTWPLQSEQFINEKLVTDVLRIGVGVGSDEWSRNERKVIVGREDIERAINQVMAVGEEAEEMRKRAMELKEKAVKANEEGGSSYSDLKSLFEELASVRDNKD
ncbi:Scopoletin glucosyltransferase [Linum perenne]